METNAFKFELKGSNDQFYCYIKIIGKLTHEDYEAFVPAFEQSLQCIKEPKVKMLIDITELEGFDIQAIWDDLKLGLKHNHEFTKIAVVGNNSLYQYGTKIGNWFTHAQMEYFNQQSKAKKWLDV